MYVHYARDGPNPRHVVVVSHSPADVSKHTYEQAEHEDEPELGLVHPAVALGYADDAPVVERASDEQRKDSPDDARQVCEALVFVVG